MVKWLLAVLMLGVIVWAGWFLYQNSRPEAQVLKQVQALEGLLNFTGTEGNIQEVVRMEMLSNVPAPECKVDNIHALINSTYNPTSFASAVLRCGKMCDFVKVRFSHIEISINSSDSATVTLEASVDAKAQQSSERLMDSADLTLNYLKINGNWKLSQVSADQMLK